MKEFMKRLKKYFTAKKLLAAILALVGFISGAFGIHTWLTGKTLPDYFRASTTVLEESTTEESTIMEEQTEDISVTEEQTLDETTVLATISAKSNNGNDATTIADSMVSIPYSGQKAQPESTAALTVSQVARPTTATTTRATTTSTTKATTVSLNTIGEYGRKVNRQDSWNLSLDIGIQAHYPEVVDDLTVSITQSGSGSYNMLYQNPTNAIIGHYQLNNGQYTLLLTYKYSGTTSTARIPISVSHIPLEIQIHMSNMEAMNKNNAKLVEYILYGENFQQIYTAS